MGIFNIFNKKSDNESAATVSLPVVEPSEAKEVVESVAPVKEEASKENKPLSVSYATGWPIDVIYGYLHKNYEDKGFADAMVKSDLSKLGKIEIDNTKNVLRITHKQKIK